MVCAPSSSTGVGGGLARKVRAGMCLELRGGGSRKEGLNFPNAYHTLPLVFGFFVAGSGTGSSANIFICISVREFYYV